FRARSLVYSTRSGWRRATSLAWNAALARVLWHAPLVRVGLHPPDVQHTAIWDQIVHLLDQLTDTRTPTTYRDWIAEQRIATTR
ncbi:MAG: DUF2334 domain-containing protein, partial [Chthoniobacterales bacterium]